MAMAVDEPSSRVMLPRTGPELNCSGEVFRHLTVPEQSPDYG